MQFADTDYRELHFDPTECINQGMDKTIGKLKKEYHDKAEKGEAEYLKGLEYAIGVLEKYKRNWFNEPPI